MYLSTQFAGGASALPFHFPINPPGKVWDHARQSWGAAGVSLPPWKADPKEPAMGLQGEQLALDLIARPGC
jgi:hypothetical protein